MGLTVTRPMRHILLAQAVLPSVIALHVAAQLATPAFAGTTTGTVAGVTRSPDGQPLPRTVVTARNFSDPNAAANRFTISGSDGAYQLTDLRPGQYEVRASKDGYQTTPAAVVTVAAAMKTPFDLTLATEASPGVAVVADANTIAALEQRVEQLEAALKALAAQQGLAAPSPR